MESVTCVGEMMCVGGGFVLFVNSVTSEIWDIGIVPVLGDEVVLLRRRRSRRHSEGCQRGIPLVEYQGTERRKGGAQKAILF